MAEKTGLSRATVRRVRESRGIPTCPRGGCGKGAAAYKMRQDGMTWSEIARRLEMGGIWTCATGAARQAANRTAVMRKFCRNETIAARRPRNKAGLTRAQWNALQANAALRYAKVIAQARGWAWPVIKKE